ncbi:MAG: NADH-quinone oxidoreductase subunit C [Alphaproteobacteria bacterium]|nr:NADH-quinone oxidoreductase subunit C [Alphaproteobacteria bacterium]
MTSTVENLKTLADHVCKSLPTRVTAVSWSRGELCLHTTTDGLLLLLTFLRDDPSCQFEQLVELCGVDYPQRPERFEVVYNLLSITLNHRIRLKLSVGEGATVPSVSALYPCANWMEREAWDLYGIIFSGHPDLRRILTDYGFEGHPLRKDFPLTGFVEVRYDDEQKRVVYEAVKLSQDYRSFDFLSPWDGMNHLLPGDEKADQPATQSSPPPPSSKAV